MILLATLIPKGALSLNPKLLHDEDLNNEVTDEAVAKEEHEKSSIPEKDSV